MGDKVQAGKVNCLQQDWICSKAFIDAYPTVKLYTGSTNGRKQDFYGIEMSSLNTDEIIAEVLEILNSSDDLYIGSHDEL